jgi:outer membrane protein assembly factor BamA
MRKILLCILCLLVTVVAAPTVAEDASSTASLREIRRLRLQEIRVTPGGETEKTVLRLIPLNIGDVIDPQVLIDTRHQLEAADVFSCVELYTERGDRPGDVILHVDAGLRRGFNFETGLGREMMRGWYLNIIGARYASPFHRGGHLRIGTHAAFRHSGTYLDGEYPRIFGDDIDMLMELSHETDQWPIADFDNIWHQDVARTRARFGLRRGSRNSAQISLWAGYSRAKPDDVMKDSMEETIEPVGRLVPVPDGAEHYLDLRLDLDCDRMDSVSPWRSGWWTGLQLKANSRMGGRVSYGAELDAHLALPMGSHSALAMRLRSAVVSDRTPYHMRPVVGGVGTLRGFAAGSLGGPLGALGLVQGTLEWREPVLGRDENIPRVTSTLFLDVGDHWLDDGNPAGASVNIGYGMLIRIPWIQILNAEVAYPLTDDLTDDSVMLMISLGRSF